MTTIAPVDTSSFTPAQLTAFNAANALGSGVSTVPKPPTAPTTATTTTVPTPPAPTATPPAGVPTVTPYLQQGIDQANNQGKPGYDVLGQAIPGATPPTPTTPTSTGTTVGGTDANGQPLLADQADRQALDQANAEYQTKSQSVSDTITNIQNGTTPLTAGEQAQVDGLKAQFQTLIDQQTLQNTGAKGLATMRGFQGGNIAGENPLFRVNTIGAIVSAGVNKLADLQIKEASAVAQLTQSFHNNDIKAVQDAWAIYQDASKTRQAALQKTIDDATKAIAAATDAQQKADQYNLDVAKFQQTKDQNAFDNAFKAEQETFAEQQKTTADTETARHNKATEAISAFSAGMGAGGGGNGVGNGITSASIGTTGGPDPVSQKAVLDQITAQYGPMTAVAIQGLADYTINPTDWSTRMVKGGQGMTREQAVTLAKMYDPTYNDAMYTVRAGYMKNLASSQTGTVGSAVNSANKAINHLTAYVTEMGQVGNGWSSLGNFAENNTFAQLDTTKRQAINAAQTEGLGVAEELAKFFKGSGTVDVASIDAWKGQLSTNASPADVAGTTQGAITLLEGQLQTLSEQYQSTMGKAPTTNFLNPSAMASLSSLKNQGYIVDIPGVYYTDATAYAKYDANAQHNMTQATHQLTAAGLPLTPDNILQLAQQQQ